MNTPAVSLGYVILYVDDVASTLAFYEKAFGLTRRFLHEGGGYGEVETGATRLAFASISIAKEMFKEDVVTTALNKPPLAAEIALVTVKIETLYQRAIQAGAVALLPPTKKPWGQTVAYVRDNAGHLVELCTPLP